MSKVTFKDRYELMKATKLLLEQYQDPTKTPMCILCGERHSWMIMTHSPEGEERTQIFGLCEQCHPKENGTEVSQDVIKKIMEKVNERMKG